MTVEPFALRRRVEVIAHRGFSARAPENTLAALALGVSAGADAVEFDLHATQDGIPVLLHDATLDRTTDRSGSIADLTNAELTGIDAGSWFSSDYEGEPVPSVQAAFDLLAPSGVRIYPEVKRTSRPEELHRVAEAAERAGLLERTVFISMDWDALDTIRSVTPQALIGYIVERPKRAEEAIERATGDPRALVDFDARILLALPGYATQANERSVPLATWTVNSVDQAERLLALGVPRITTNKVADLVAWRDTL